MKNINESLRDKKIHRYLNSNIHGSVNGNIYAQRVNNAKIISQRMTNAGIIRIVYLDICVLMEKSVRRKKIYANIIIIVKSKIRKIMKRYLWVI